MTAFLKDGSAVLDYVVDWSAWLDDAETLTAATVTAATGITVDSSSHDDTTVTFWLSGGTDGQDYTVTCHVTTSAGRQDDRTVRIRVRQR